MAVPTIAVANYFIGKGQAEGVPITPMKLLKLVYIAHGWHLGLSNQPLIAEDVQAWKFGPVVDSVYQDFKHYGAGDISRQKAVWDNDGEYRIPSIQDPKLQSFLDSVWNAYKHLNGLQLSDITHQPGTPWYETWVTNDGRRQRGAVIQPDLIRSHYQELAQKRNAA